MAHLKLLLLGPFQATMDGEPVDGFESNKVRALLAYLAVEADRPHPREKLAGLLWPERPDRDARRNLRYALSNLRQAIGDQQAMPPFLHVTRQAIQFDAASDAWVDVTAFERLLESEAPIAHELEEAVDLYRGEFLEGFSLDDSAAFEEWALLKREQIGRQVLATLHDLAEACERCGEYERALPHAWRQVVLEPWREQAHRQLMRLLALNGQRGAALAQYEACRRVLGQELGVEPAAETRQLYERIRDGEVGRADPAENQASARQTEDARPHQSAGTSPAPVPLPPTQHHASRRPAVRRLALLGFPLLLLVLLGALVLVGSGYGTTGPSEVATSQPTPGGVQPGGAKIVGVCEDPSQPRICVYDGRVERLIQTIDCPQVERVGGASWSPDGQQIVFDARPRADPSPGHRLYVVAAPDGADVDGSGLRLLTSGDTSDMLPTWSPDGQWIAFHRGGALWIVRPDGTEAQKLFEGEWHYVGESAWSPDSQQIAFMRGTDRKDLDPAEIWAVRRDGTAPRLVHSFAQQAGIELLAWSPDGQKIVCHRLFDGGKMTTLLVSASGSDEPQVLDEVPWSWFPSFWPQWGQAR